MQNYLDLKTICDSEDEVAINKDNDMICVMRCCQATDVDVESTMASSPASQTVPRHPSQHQVPRHPLLPVPWPQTPPHSHNIS